MGAAVALACLGVALTGARGDSAEFAQPVVTGVSGTCASIEFTYSGGEDPLKTAYVFAKRPGEPDFGQWGKAVSLLKVDHPGPAGQRRHTRYHALLRELPVGTDFEVKVSSISSLVHAEASRSSKVATTSHELASPEAPSRIEVRRTDLRVNKRKHDGSVCVDLEWAHPHQKLTRQVGDVYFRVLYQYKGEEAIQLCEDEIGSLHHRCAEPLALVKSEMPSSFRTICGLRPQRWIRFTVQAFTCDSLAAAGGPSADQKGGRSKHVEVVSPTSAPSVITTLVTEPANQESVAGFHPRVVLNWMPENRGLIAGHAVYLGLVGLSAIKLLCWVPHDGSKYAKGHLTMPIKHKNHTYARDTLLLQDYLSKYHVHHEQELIVTTMTTQHLESPAYSKRLGGWLVMENAVKCLTSFQAKYPSYVARPRILAWTQAEALALYD